MSTKVFVGNLAFRTTDQDLEEAFAACGQVKQGVIITRGRRSLGYGFVEFTNAENAANAVTKMNKTDLFGRQVKVELAKDPAERPAPTDGGEPGPAKRRRRSPAPRNERSSDRTASPANEGADRPRRRRQPRKPRRNSENASPPVHTERKPPKEKIPSKTTLFVANLPFSAKDEQLAQAFAGTKFKSAHVVCTRTGRSRGYGFVEFENEADQQEALASTNGKLVPGNPAKENSARNISVTVSNSVPPTVTVTPASDTATTTTTTATTKSDSK